MKDNSYFTQFFVAQCSGPLYLLEATQEPAMNLVEEFHGESCRAAGRVSTGYPLDGGFNTLDAFLSHVSRATDRMTLSYDLTLLSPYYA